MKTRYEDLEVIDVPHALVDVADRRTMRIIATAINWPDALRQIARSCYLQGLIDGEQVAVSTPKGAQS